MQRIHLYIIAAAVSLVLSAWLLAGGFKRKPAGEYITVTGMAEVSFNSDKIQWSGDYSRTGMELKDAYAAVKSDLEKVKAYFKSKGVLDSEMVFSTISIDKMFDYVHEDGSSRSVFRGYKASQRITITSRRLDDIEKVARESMELIEQGLEFNSGATEFYYTRLADLKLDLIDKAAKDARQRAEKIAGASGAAIGELKKSTLGVFQITGEGQNEEYSWGGVFNTTSRKKTARVTVSAGYSAK